MPASHRSETDPMRLPSAIRKVPPGFGSDPLCAGVSPVDKSLVDADAGRLPSWRSAAGVFVKQNEGGETRANWLREPCTYEPATEASDGELESRLNAIFRDAFDNELVPTLTDVAGAAGYSSVVQMCNDARRKGPARMRAISRALSAVQSYYERIALSGNRMALEILRTIPQFDALESPEQIATRAFAPQPSEIVVRLAGMERHEDRGKELSPMDAYNQLIAEPTFSDIASATTLVQDEDGVFVLPDLNELVDSK